MVNIFYSLFTWKTHHSRQQTRKLTKSARAPQWVDPSPPQTQNAKDIIYTNPTVKVISPNSKVIGPKFHPHSHLSLTCSPRAQTDHTGDSSIHKNLKVKVIASRSKITGPKFYAQAHLPLIVAHRHKLVMLASIPRKHKRPQESQGQGHGTKVKSHRTKFPCQCTSTHG